MPSIVVTQTSMGHLNGSKIKLSGTGFAPNTLLHIRIDLQEVTGEPTTDGSGNFPETQLTLSATINKGLVDIDISDGGHYSFPNAVISRHAISGSFVGNTTFLSSTYAHGLILTSAVFISGTDVALTWHNDNAGDFIIDVDANNNSAIHIGGTVGNNHRHVLKTTYGINDDIILDSNKVTKTDTDWNGFRDFTTGTRVYTENGDPSGTHSYYINNASIAIYTEDVPDEDDGTGDYWGHIRIRDCDIGFTFVGTGFSLKEIRGGSTNPNNLFRVTDCNRVMTTAMASEKLDFFNCRFVNIDSNFKMSDTSHGYILRNVTSLNTGTGASTKGLIFDAGVVATVTNSLVYGFSDVEVEVNSGCTITWGRTNEDTNVVGHASYPGGTGMTITGSTTRVYFPPVTRDLQNVFQYDDEGVTIASSCYGITINHCVFNELALIGVSNEGIDTALIGNDFEGGGVTPTLLDEFEDSFVIENTFDGANIRAIRMSTCDPTIVSNDFGLTTENPVDIDIQTNCNPLLKYNYSKSGRTSSSNWFCQAVAFGSTVKMIGNRFIRAVIEKPSMMNMNDFGYIKVTGTDDIDLVANTIRHKTTYAVNAHIHITDLYSGTITIGKDKSGNHFKDLNGHAILIEYDGGAVTGEVIADYNTSEMVGLTGKQFLKVEASNTPSLIEMQNNNLYGDEDDCGGVDNDCAVNVDATYNFWGGPFGPSGDYKGSGAPIYGLVDFKPYNRKETSFIGMVVGENVISNNLRGATTITRTLNRASRMVVGIENLLDDIDINDFEGEFGRYTINGVTWFEGYYDLNSLTLTPLTGVEGDIQAMDLLSLARYVFIGNNSKWHYTDTDAGNIARDIIDKINKIKRLDLTYTSLSIPTAVYSIDEIDIRNMSCIDALKKLAKYSGDYLPYFFIDIDRVAYFRPFTASSKEVDCETSIVKRTSRLERLRNHMTFKYTDDLSASAVVWNLASMKAHGQREDEWRDKRFSVTENAEDYAEGMLDDVDDPEIKGFWKTMIPTREYQLTDIVELDESRLGAVNEDIAVWEIGHKIMMNGRGSTKIKYGAVILTLDNVVDAETPDEQS